MDKNCHSPTHDNTPKKSPFDDLSRDDLIAKCKGLLVIAQKAKQAKSELQNELHNCKVQLAKSEEELEKEKKFSIENLKTLQELVDSLTEQKLNYITEIDTSRNKIKALNDKCINYEKEIEKCKLYITDCEKSVAETSVKVSNFDTENISLKRQNSRLTEENEQLITQLTELETKIAEFNNIGLKQREQLEILEEKVDSGESFKLEIEKLNKIIKYQENELKSIEILENTNQNYESKIKELETKIAEFNEIGLKQREQLGILEQVDSDASLKLEIEQLNKIIKDQENELKLSKILENTNQNYESKIKEVTELYETEKAQKEKVNIKLKSYKDKILKCATCINQLKNSRFILSKIVKEYSETIPKWQNDIIQASKVLSRQINELSNENILLKDNLQRLELQIQESLRAQNEVDINIQNCKINELNNENKSLKCKILNLSQQITEYTENINDLKFNLESLQSKYQELKEIDLPAQINENKALKEQVNEIAQKCSYLTVKNHELNKSVEEINSKNTKLNSLLEESRNSDVIGSLALQIKALESEKSILVKEKLTARDNVVDLEKQNKTLTDNITNMRLEIQTLQFRLDTMSQEKLDLQNRYKTKHDENLSDLRGDLLSVQEKYDLLKKEYDNIIDLNGLLKEEVETLKLSLEQPKDESDNLSDLNTSLQADIVKLETKLAAYKLENSSLLSEIKDSRVRLKEFDSIIAENEAAKAKLLSYKTENAELLNEMKEINQVLKERGEAISKLQKAIDEMETLIDTLERDRDELKKERDDLLKKNEILEKDLKSAEEKSAVERSDTYDRVVVERDNALKCGLQKDSIIASFRDEIEKLKLQQSNSELPNEDMSTSTISKAEEHARMKDLDETFEEKYSKLRIFALKLKKKLNETTSQLQNAEQDKTKLEKLIKDHDLSKATIISCVETDSKQSNEKVYTQSDVSKLETKIQDYKNKTAEIEKIKVELLNKEELLYAEINAHKSTRDALEKARREAKKKDVLSLEMEDYERSMKDLTFKMEDSKKKIIQMESTIDTQESTIVAMKTQIKLLEEQIKTEETQNRLAKEELQRAIEEAKEKDSVIQMKNDIILKLEGDFEDEKRKNEDTNLDMVSLLSEKEKVIINLSEEKTDINNKMKRLEFKCAEFEEKLRITNIEFEDLKAEYTSYKVRAQAVLRQNQMVDHSQEEQLKEEAAALKAQIEALNVKLNAAQDRCSEQSAEVEASRRRVAEATSEAARAQQRTTRLHADLARLTQQLESERAQHKLQVSTLTQCYKTQISDLEMKHLKEIDELQKQMEFVQDNAKARKLDEINRNSQYVLPVLPKDEGSDGEMDINVSMIPREDGEGSESAPSPPLSKVYQTSAGSGRSPVPLERLLEEGVPEDDPFDTTSLALTPEQEVVDLRKKIQAQQQRVKHLTLLLSESEREGARMAQLSELLKSELRRVQGNAQNTHNTEYVKNVTLKFLTLPPGDERTRLVPVLQKILTLTNAEAQKMQAIAKGVDPNSSKGWGSYLPWPGGK